MSGRAKFPLSSADIKKLKKGYKVATMKAAASATVGKLYPPGAPFATGVVDWLYGSRPISPKDRERCLIALLCQRQDGALLAVHIYWGLMEGLTLNETCHTLLLAGAYTGIPNYSSGLMTLTKTCAILKQAVGAGETQVPQVLEALFIGFGLKSKPKK